ncbi:Ribonuclease Z [Lachnellula suecica]|uniref:ribonuclease Z n=1 Tax=Lachnellula suecica TaxID=602035 RepID=A0A8T9CKD0_9HELO|nr:Ribonuclease Z [Lachnellula suecica]
MPKLIPTSKNHVSRFLRKGYSSQTTTSLVGRNTTERRRTGPIRFPFSESGQPLKKNICLKRIVQGPRLRIDFSKHYLPKYYLALDPIRRSSLGSTPGIQRRESGGNIMKFWVQFLSTPTADTPGTTLVLHFDKKRYLIGNIGEGTQRAAVQRKLGLGKVGDIFLTGPVGWHNAGGLLGMILTVADVVSTSKGQSGAAEGRKDKNRREHGNKAANPTDEEKVWLNLHGGTNLTHLLATARRFIFRKGMPLRTTEFKPRTMPRGNWEPTWQDDLINVWDMVIEPEGQSVTRRKRSHEEFSDDSEKSATGESTGTLEEREDRYDQMRKGVVASMFDSEWKLDALMKKKLSEVALPAAIFVRNSEGKIEKYKGPMPEEGKDIPDVDVLVRSPWPGALIDELPPTKPSFTSVCYIIKGHPQRGKFNPNAAKDLGVKPGPDFRRLTNGESVTTASGSVVAPEMVLSPTKEGTGFAVVELPSALYVESLVSRAEWSLKEVMAGVAAVVWILGPGVIEDTRLQKFMADHSEMKHIISSKDCCPDYLALESPASAAIRLNLLDPERFPVPKYSNYVTEQQSEGQKPYQKAIPGLTLQLEPKVEFQEDKVIHHLDTEAVVKEMLKEVLDLAELSRAEIMSSEYQAKLNENQKDIPSKDAEVVTLGTGSALPSKYRNVSATLIRVPGYGTYLLDCGENTLGQLKRVYGDELPEVLCDLRAIWISHLHADHHLGTASVIKAWAEETARLEDTKSNKLHVISHEGMIQWLREYSEVEDFGYSRVNTLMVGRSDRKFFKFDHQFEPEQVKSVGISSIQACQVEHCHGAAAVAINFPNGFKVAYSGDCRPSNEFVKIGQGATLLVHEATFDDELQGDAIAKKHSTTAEALDIGKRMKARRILLTHFSQRYQKIPVMDSQGGKDQVAIVAFDYMRVKLGDFAKLDAFKPALMKLYEDENEGRDGKAAGDE